MSKEHPLPGPLADPLTTPSQVKFPGRAVARTIVASLITTIAVLNTLLPTVIDATGKQFIWINTIAITVATITGIITRVMAIPQVNEWLRSLNLSATK